MDTPFIADVHKENVHVGGGKATVMKPVKLKPAGEKRKALADLRSKVKSGNQMTKSKQQIAEADRCTNRVSKVANLNTSLVLDGKFGKDDNKPFVHSLTDDEIKQCYEWAKDGIEEMGGYSWSKKDEANLVMNQTLSEIMASATGVSVSELEQPFLSEDEGYVTDSPDIESVTAFQGFNSSYYTHEELVASFGLSGILLDEYPVPELKSDEDFSLSNDN